MLGLPAFLLIMACGPVHHHYRAGEEREREKRWTVLRGSDWVHSSGYLPLRPQSLARTLVDLLGGGSVAVWGKGTEERRKGKEGAQQIRRNAAPRTDRVASQVAAVRPSANRRRKKRGKGGRKRRALAMASLPPISLWRVVYTLPSRTALLEVTEHD